MTQQANPTVRININGQEQDVLSFVPGNNRKVALVDLETLKEMASMLDTIDFRRYKGDLSDIILAQTSLENLVNRLDKEVAFHKTVNLVKEFVEKDKEETGVMQA